MYVNACWQTRTGTTTLPQWLPPQSVIDESHPPLWLLHTPMDQMSRGHYTTLTTLPWYTATDTPSHQPVTQSLFQIIITAIRSTTERPFTSPQHNDNCYTWSITVTRCPVTSHHIHHNILERAHYKTQTAAPTPYRPHWVRYCHSNIHTWWRFKIFAWRQPPHTAHPTGTSDS